MVKAENDSCQHAETLTEDRLALNISHSGKRIFAQLCGCTRKLGDVTPANTGGSGGGFFLACEDFCEKVRPFSPRLRFFLKWRLQRSHKSHSL